MIEKDIILRRLSNLEEYYKDLEEAKKELNIEKFLSDKVMRRYVERTLHMAIESCLDIGGHIISYQGYREPHDNQDVFQVLIEEKLLDEELGKQLKKMAKFRNIIVHDYTKLDPEIVYNILTSEVKDIKYFSYIIKEKYFNEK